MSKAIVQIPRSLAIVLLMMMFLGPLVAGIGVAAEESNNREDQRVDRAIAECELVQIVSQRAYLAEFARIFREAAGRSGADEGSAFEFDPDGRLPDLALPPNVYATLQRYGNVCEEFLPVPPADGDPLDPNPPEIVKEGEHLATWFVFDQAYAGETWGQSFYMPELERLALQMEE